MADIRVLDVLVLPRQLSHNAPSAWGQEKPWFEQVDKLNREVWDFDHECEIALITAGIGGNRCPTVDQWATFAVAGGIIAALSGKVMQPPATEPYDWPKDYPHFIWEALWQAYETNQEKLDRTFMGAMLRDFMPRLREGGPLDHNFSQCDFEQNWGVGVVGHHYADTIFQSVGNVRISCLREGHKALGSLPVNVVNSISQVAQHIPRMLEIVIRHMKKTYQW